jgi:glycosyltransferase involved in cell wall biosynthesis
MRVTVAICTWNRARLLDQTLTEFHNLRIPAGVEWELIAVNNNSTDDTDAVLARHAFKLPLFSLFERCQGKSYAANLAVQHSRGDLILWTDDDVLVDPEWLAEYVKAAEQWPSATFFGGTIDPWFAEEPPRWIRRHFSKISSVYATRQLGPEVRPLVRDELPFGANMALRRQAFAAQQFNPRFGPSGNSYVPCEETELLKRLQGDGYQGLWVGPARVRHYVPSERLRKKYVWNWFRGMGRYLARKQSYEDCKWLWGAPRWAIWKYWRNRVQSLFLTPFQGTNWIDAFRDAALCQGIIEESRAVSAAQDA